MKKGPGYELRENLKARDREELDINELARRKSLEAFLRIVKVAEDERPKDWDDSLWGPWKPLRHRNVKDYILAQTTIIERAYGKPKQAMEHSGPEGAAIPYNLVDAPPQETREQWEARKAKEEREARMESAARPTD